MRPFVARPSLTTRRYIRAAPTASHFSRPFSTPAPATPQPTSSRDRVQPTTFSGKSSPREVHARPELLRGMPTGSKVPLPASGAASSGQGLEEGFDGPSRPRMRYERPKERRDLPKGGSRFLYYGTMAALGLGAWGVFILYATNAERLASSVMRSLTFQLRNSPDVGELLGSPVRLSDPWWGFGDPWISGSVNTMQGRVDLKFRATGSKQAGTVYFTSIRPQEGGGWRIVRYKVIGDNGETLRLEDKVDKVPIPS